MNFYDDEKNVEQYISMAEGYDGKELVDLLTQHLPPGSSVLEIGMGPGVDLLMLDRHYTVTGSDASQLFLDRFRAAHADADLLQLDAVALGIDRRFDAIYSNKVLHHLSREELAKSFQRQAMLLNEGGLALHSFWEGNREEEHAGLLFVYYTCDALKRIVADEFTIIACASYTEMAADDSLYLLLQKRA